MAAKKFYFFLQVPEDISCTKKTKIYLEPDEIIKSKYFLQHIAYFVQSSPQTKKFSFVLVSSGSP